MLISQNTFTSDVSPFVDSIISSLKEVPKNAVIFIDVDDTLITPVSKSFRSSPGQQIIDHIKKNKDQYAHYETIISHWRLQRSIMLVDQRWPDTITHLKASHRVYGLTKMDTGKFGAIDSVERWRYLELKKMGITFTDNHNLQEYPYETDASFSQQPSFYKGIFFTGSATKGHVFSLYQKILSPPFVVLIDDREEQLHCVGQICQQHSIPFLGIHFKGARQLTGQYDPVIADIQKHYLLEHAQWLEDEEAEKLLNKI